MGENGDSVCWWDRWKLCERPNEGLTIAEHLELVRKHDRGNRRSAGIGENAARVSNDRKSAERGETVLCKLLVT